MNRVWQLRIKRLIDLVFVASLAPFASAICAWFALLIRYESPGNPIFTQKRLGLNGKTFTIYKLRTMVENAEHIGAGLYAEKDDPRFTRIGRLARRFSVDELPQMLNVLKGEMSVVGPRPMPSFVTDQYPDDYEIILRVKPGLTGFVQINGRNDLPRSERLELDKRYVHEWSIWQDLSIIVKTVDVVLRATGQRNDQGAEDVEQ